MQSHLSQSHPSTFPDCLGSRSAPSQISCAPERYPQGAATHIRRICNHREPPRRARQSGHQSGFASDRISVLLTSYPADCCRFHQRRYWHCWHCWPPVPISPSFLACGSWSTMSLLDTFYLSGKTHLARLNTGGIAGGHRILV